MKEIGNNELMKINGGRNDAGTGGGDNYRRNSRLDEKADKRVDGDNNSYHDAPGEYNFSPGLDAMGP